MLASVNEHVLVNALCANVQTKQRKHLGAGARAGVSPENVDRSQDQLAGPSGQTQAGSETAGGAHPVGTNGCAGAQGRDRTLDRGKHGASRPARR